MESDRPADGLATVQPDHSQKLAGFPFHEFLATRIEPCAIDQNTYVSMRFHLLDCGHTVAVDYVDTRCGLNCLHVSTWMIQRLSQSQEGSIDLNPGKSLFQSLTTSATQPHDPLKPPQTHHQGHDKIFCEMCHGIPFGSYELANPEHVFRRALSLTRPVIEHFTQYEGEMMNYALSPLLFNPQHKVFSPELTHYLTCGHEVWCRPTRPCAANCKDMPACRGRNAPNNVKQGDAIICKECTYRAELVYSRYVVAGRGGAQEEAARDGLPERPNHDGRNNQTTESQRTVNDHGEMGDQTGHDPRSSEISDLSDSIMDTEMEGDGAHEGFGMFGTEVGATMQEEPMEDKQNDTNE